MTERELYVHSIDSIAEIALKCRKLSPGEYAVFRDRAINDTPQDLKPFIQKLFWIIDDLLKKLAVKGIKPLLPEKETSEE